MWGIVIIVGFALMALGAIFLIGYFIGISDGLNMIEEPEDERHLWCLDCQDDTPVKEKNGDFFCSDCNAYHGTKI